MKLVGLSDKLKAAGLTQKKLAEKLDMTEKAVSELVNGKAFPTTKNLDKLLAEFITLDVMTAEGVVMTISEKDQNPNPTPAPARKRGTGAGG